VRRRQFKFEFRKEVISMATSLKRLEEIIREQLPVVSEPEAYTIATAIADPDFFSINMA
jgi:hypothetical protein